MNNYFYHFTHIDNLESIIKNGLLCTNKKNELGISHYNVANKSIQGRRSEMEVICEDKKSYGNVHDYIPFYFSTRNPMLLSIIHQKRVDQPEIIFFGVKTEMIKSNNFIFTDASANAGAPPNFYNDYQNLNKLNWNIINAKKWSYTQNEKRQKMAEVLIKNFNFSFVDHIVVFNKSYKDKVKAILDDCNVKIQPKIKDIEPIEGNYFYYTKFTMKGRENEDLVTGPKRLKRVYDLANEIIKKERVKKTKFTCASIEELIERLDEDFCFIEETKGIFKLETKNDVHSDTVSDHTLKVVENIRIHPEFDGLQGDEQNILLLSAYLHDIGKGPHDKWADKIQPAYPDHPADSLKQAVRVLIEDIKILSNEDIRILTLLIAYHDILGDLSKDCRNTIELKNIITNKNDLKLLYILSQADTLAISEDWYDNLNDHFEEIKSKIL